MAKLIINLLLNGFAIGLGVEGAIALIAGILLILLLATNLFDKKPPKESESSEDGKDEKRKGGNKEKHVEAPEAAPAAVVAEESPVQIIREINTVYVPVNMGEERAEEPAPAPAAAEDKKEEKDTRPVIINVYNNEEKETQQQPVVEGEEGGVKFNESKTIEELYEELSNEQKSFFDELKNTALAKPNAVLSITKTYENIKIGKRSIIKLIIRRGVTVAEFLLENDALKEYRLSSQNKKGKSKIKIRPTVLAVTELDTLKAAVDMIHLAYQQIIED